MGYYSQMEIDLIKSDLSSEQIAALKKEKETELDKWSGEYFKMYSFKEESKGKYRVLVYEDTDYNAKHYADHELAYFISLIIKKNFVCELLFTGEDGDRWGFEISKNKIAGKYVKWHTGNSQTTEKFKQLLNTKNQIK